jgi:hypothetical protein
VGDGVGVDVETITGRQNVADHPVDAAEKLLMLQLLIAEPNQGLKRNLVAKPMIVAEF